jgi:hypothetical protein
MLEHERHRLRPLPPLRQDRLRHAIGHRIEIGVAPTVGAGLHRERSGTLANLLQEALRDGLLEVCPGEGNMGTARVDASGPDRLLLDRLARQDGPDTHGRARISVVCMPSRCQPGKFEIDLYTVPCGANSTSRVNDPRRGSGNTRHVFAAMSRA